MYQGGVHTYDPLRHPGDQGMDFTLTALAMDAIAMYDQLGPENWVPNENPIGVMHIYIYS